MSKYNNNGVIFLCVWDYISTLAMFRVLDYTMDGITDGRLLPSPNTVSCNIREIHPTWLQILYNIPIRRIQTLVNDLAAKPNIFCCEISLTLHSSWPFYIGPFNPCSAMQITCLPSPPEKHGRVNVHASVLKFGGKLFSVAWVLIIKALPLWIHAAKLCSVQPSPAHEDTDCNEA